MVRLFRWLFFGDAHMHKWVCVNSVNNNVESGIPNEIIRELECSVCGNRKEHRITS